jgi:hypothetical protein
MRAIDPDDLSVRARHLHAHGWQVRDIAAVLHVPTACVDAWLVPLPAPTVPALDFAEWVQYLFDNPPDYRWFDRITAWDDLPSAVLVDYLTRLFTAAGTVLAPFSDAQINQTLWFLVGEGSDGAAALFDAAVPWAERRTCLEATLALFTGCFLPRCTPALSHRDESASALNSICYMWWDLFPTWGAPEDPRRAELDALVLSLLERILDLPSDACRESALHGLGHWMSHYPERVVGIVDAWLRRQPGLRPALRTYALAARCGCVL